MSPLVLTLKEAPAHRLDASVIAPDRLAGLDLKRIAAQQVWYEGAPGELAVIGDFFQVSGKPGLTVRVVGDCSRVDGLGRDMLEGELIVEGPAGRETGAAMHGGTVTVKGDADRDAGMAMRGGTLIIEGNAGDNLGGAPPGASRGMLAGEIIVRGRAGAEVGARMRRGVIHIDGDSGERAGLGMIAGTVVVGGSTGPDAGLFLKRGTGAVFGRCTPAPGFRRACTYAPPHLRLLLTSLRTRFGVALSAEQVSGLYHRYSGDLAEVGKGEILAWSGA